MVWNTVGNLAHIASFHCELHPRISRLTWDLEYAAAPCTGFISSVHIGGCTAQTSSMSVGPQELLGLIRVCKLNTLGLYATFLSDLISAARSDPEIGAALKGLRQIVHTGVALNKDNEDWAYANGLNIIVSARRPLAKFFTPGLICVCNSAHTEPQRRVNATCLTISLASRYSCVPYSSTTQVAVRQGRRRPRYAPYPWRQRHVPPVF